MNPEENTETQLIRNWRSGDRTAGDQLLRRYAPLLQSFFSRKVNRNVDDLVQRTLLACVQSIDRFEGKRLNSPNDLVYKSDGSLYFTDPPYGLIGQDQDPAKYLRSELVSGHPPGGPAVCREAAVSLCRTRIRGGA